MNATVPKSAQSSPHTLSQKRARRALRAVAGSLPVRIAISTPDCNVLSAGDADHQGEPGLVRDGGRSRSGPKVRTVRVISHPVG
ncbi:hypothetical protein GCM10010270_49350 [Streptomyces violaceus]|nr:hypothetical protein GCM10010270_49350 [Streptomyces janthinus]